VKAFLAMRQHAMIEIRHKTLVDEFRFNAEQRLKCLIIAAMIDEAHETKLKCLRFFDKIQPVLLKSKALVMMKWIVYHTHFVKLEMGD
jgi:hypothetical protein